MEKKFLIQWRNNIHQRQGASDLRKSRSQWHHHCRAESLRQQSNRWLNPWKPLLVCGVFGRWEATMKIHIGTDFCALVSWPTRPCKRKNPVRRQRPERKDMKIVVMLQIGTQRHKQSAMIQMYWSQRGCTGTLLLIPLQRLINYLDDLVDLQVLSAPQVQSRDPTSKKQKGPTSTSGLRVPPK